MPQATKRWILCIIRTRSMQVQPRPCYRWCPAYENWQGFETVLCLREKRRLRVKPCWALSLLTRSYWARHPETCLGREKQVQQKTVQANAERGGFGFWHSQHGSRWTTRRGIKSGGPSRHEHQIEGRQLKLFKRLRLRLRLKSDRKSVV